MVKKKNLVEIEKPQNNNVIRPVCPEKKTWRQHQVDINLKEEWLEKLNLLKRFKLTSVCEGHYDPENPQRIRNYPQVAIKFNFMKGFDVLSLFEQKGRKLKDILKKCFNEKYINAEFHYHFDVAASSYSCEFIFNCWSRFPRISEKPDKNFNYFYENCIIGVLKIDQIFEEMLKNIHH